MYFNLDSMLQAGHLLSQLVQVGFQKVLHLPKKPKSFKFESLSFVVCLSFSADYFWLPR